jgi:3-hydroxybutyryl-CoA dehydrogenase
MKIQNIGVVGAGQMGQGIAQVCAQSGFTTILVDAQESQLERSKLSIATSLEKLVAKGKLQSEQKDTALANLQWNAQLGDLKKADLIIEAIVENEDAKIGLFRSLSEIVSSQCIFASNTSSIPITRIAAASDRPKLCIGMHFMNPVPIMKLVEIIPALTTDPSTKEQIFELAHALGKTTVESKDYPGFIVNRILMPMINEAFYALMNGIGSPEAIDQGMKLGTNQPMGPLELADFIGLDTCKYILDVMYQGLGDQRYSPCPLLCKYVEARHFGRKTGRGVYEY